MTEKEVTTHYRRIMWCIKYLSVSMTVAFGIGYLSGHLMTKWLFY